VTLHSLIASAFIPCVALAVDLFELLLLLPEHGQNIPPIFRRRLDAESANQMVNFLFFKT
jgi:hypothetical protein